MKKIALIMDGWKRWFTFAWPAGILQRIRQTGEEVSLYIFKGKDVEDKWKEAGLHPYAVDGTTAVEEADLIFVCKTQYTQDMKPECFDVKENDEKWYPDKDYHTMYMGEIVKVLKRV